jgi:hypothetical protein
MFSADPDYLPRSAWLWWKGASWSSVDIYRNGQKIANTQNDGGTRDIAPSSGTYTYKVCAPGSTTVCSATDTVTVR